MPTVFFFHFTTVRIIPFSHIGVKVHPKAHVADIPALRVQRPFLSGIGGHVQIERPLRKAADGKRPGQPRVDTGRTVCRPVPEIFRQPPRADHGKPRLLIDPAKPGAVFHQRDASRVLRKNRAHKQKAVQPAALFLQKPPHPLLLRVREPAGLMLPRFRQKKDHILPEGLFPVQKGTEEPFRKEASRGGLRFAHLRFACPCPFPTVRPARIQRSPEPVLVPDQPARRPACRVAKQLLFQLLRPVQQTGRNQHKRDLRLFVPVRKAFQPARAGPEKGQI